MGPQGIVFQKLIVIWEGLLWNLPNIGFGILFLGLAFGFGKLAALIIRTVANKRGRQDLGRLLGSLAFGAIMIASGLFTIAIIFPSVNPSDVFATLGIGSVAIGFAFKDILQNLLAGLLLLITRPYKRGDQIVVRDYEGTVEQVESRATLIRTYDGRRVIIPNGDLYTSPVTVNTASEVRRDEFVVGIGYGDDPNKAIAIFADAIGGVEGVQSSPAPEVLATNLNESTIDLKARWWSKSSRSDLIHVRSRVILAIQAAASQAGIDIAYPTQVVLFHDQTEETDGDRTAQREGWPAGDKPPKPRRLRLIEEAEGTKQDLVSEKI